MNATKQRARLVAVRRAQWRLKQRLDTIDYEFDVLKPEIEDLEDGLARGEILEIEVVSEDSSKK